MAGDTNKESKDVGEVASNVEPAGKSAEEKGKKKNQRGILSRIWNGIFRLRSDDFEKRLEHITKEEAAILARMKRRALSWRRMARNLIIFSVLFEIIAVGYAIMTTRTVNLNWRMRALRVAPMFFLPALSSLLYSTLGSFNKMRDNKDQKTVERLRAERQAKIDELKERTNYYITQQLIQKYDSDPAAKAAAATVLASKLGADSGLKVFLGEETNPLPVGKSNDVEFKQSSTGLRKRHPADTKSIENPALHQSDRDVLHGAGSDASEISKHDQLVVEHADPSLNAQDGGWIARIAALLVGEDPTQSYALICGNCHRHNGLVRKEDFPFTTYYCPHCGVLNRPKHLEERPSGGTMPADLAASTKVVDEVKLIKNGSAEIKLIDNTSEASIEKVAACSSPTKSAAEATEATERIVPEDLGS